jgi:hypothetical protein
LLRYVITRLPFCLQLALPRLNGPDGAVHLQSDRWRFHSGSQQLAQHIVVGKRPRAARWTLTRHLRFAFRAARAWASLISNSARRSSSGRSKKLSITYNPRASFGSSLSILQSLKTQAVNASCSVAWFDQQRAFHELATIIAGENAFASKIKVRALKAVAVYDALVRRIIPAHFFALSPSSTRRRIASDSLGGGHQHFDVRPGTCSTSC